jgi:hypothetical protein
MDSKYVRKTVDNLLAELERNLGLTQFGGRSSYAAFFAFTECISSNSIGLL